MFGGDRCCWRFLKPFRRHKTVWHCLTWNMSRFCRTPKPSPNSIGTCLAGLRQCGSTLQTMMGVQCDSKLRILVPESKTRDHQNRLPVRNVLSTKSRSRAGGWWVPVWHWTFDEILVTWRLTVSTGRFWIGSGIRNSCFYREYIECFLITGHFWSPVNDLFLITCQCHRYSSNR